MTKATGMTYNSDTLEFVLFRVFLDWKGDCITSIESHSGKTVGAAVRWIAL